MKKKPYIKVYAQEEMLAQFRLKAAARGLPLSAWMLQAALAYERRNKVIEPAWWASGWRRDVKCHVCGAHHDPLQSHPELGSYDESELALGRVWQQ